MNAVTIPLPSDGRVTNVTLPDANTAQIAAGGLVVVLFCALLIGVVLMLRDLMRGAR